MPESSRRDLDGAVKTLKLSLGASLSDEVKLNSISEGRYLRFLRDLEKMQAVLFATATDAGLNEPAALLKHQQIQVAQVRENIPRMRFAGGKQGVSLLADQLEQISPQLYAQLVCQVDLLHDVLGRAINYFAQRVPGTLAAFRWRIDQKNTSKSTFEEAFEKIAPALLQTRSFREPAAKVEGFDYRRMSAFEYTVDEVPEYLAQDYGLRVENALNIGKILREDLKFEDSRSSVGVQIADLLASGLRRCLRGQFRAQHDITVALGKLTLQNQRGKYPIHLVSFSQEEEEADSTASAAIQTLIVACSVTYMADSTPNLSFHPTCYGWLRQPPQAGELKR